MNVGGGTGTCLRKSHLSEDISNEEKLGGDERHLCYHFPKEMTCAELKLRGHVGELEGSKMVRVQGVKGRCQT